VTFIPVKFIALGALLPVLFGAQAATAQSQPAGANPALEITQPEGAAELGRHLSRLASNPRDVDALIGAGEAALKLNDPRAATGFFARAQDISPSNARVKAGLARSMVGMENPVEALRLFNEAVRLGTREADIALDRGLAFDLTGDPARAQNDYKVALERDPRNAVLIRRYAVSLGISGNWQEADRLLDPLLRKSDRNAWRDRAFIFAMNGRAKEAQDITSVMMPPNMAAAIKPFMDRMPSLTAAQRAAAVHFGNFPAGTVRTAGAGIAAPPKPSVQPVPKPVSPAAPAASAANASQAKQRPRPEPKQPAAAQPAVPARPAAIPPARTVAEVSLPSSPPRRLSDTAPAPAVASDRIGPPVEEPVPAPVAPENRRSLADIMSTVSVPEAERTPAVAPVDLAEVARIQAQKRKAEQAAAAKAKAEAEAKAKAKAEAEAKAAAKAEAAEKARNPARIWVQIATGRDVKALAFDMGKLRKKHPALLKGKDAWTSPWGATRRMVIGPFGDTGGARSFVSDWMKAGGDGYIWQSTEGLEVAKLPE
jgi:Flp pilus assembly protein TadD